MIMVMQILSFSQEPGLLVGVVVFYIAIIALCAVPSFVIFWKLYRKAGQPGWASLIPGYSSYAMGLIVGNPTLGIVTGIAAIASYVVNILSLPWLILALVLLNKFVKHYDAGLGRWLLFIFLPIIGVFFVDKTNFKGTNGIVPQVNGSTGTRIFSSSQQSTNPTSSPEVIAQPQTQPVPDAQPSNPSNQQPSVPPVPPAQTI